MLLSSLSIHCMASVYSSLVHRLRVKSKVSFHGMMNSAMRNEYEQLSPELPAFLQSVIHDRLVGLNLALTVSWFVVSW